MKSKPEPSVRKRRLIITPIAITTLLMGFYVVETNTIYKSMKVSLVKTASVEYGSANYKLEDLVDKVDGEITKIKKDVDPSKVGSQEVVVELEKDKVVKEVTLNVEVKDTTAPETKVKEENISITEGDDVDVLGNIEKVADVVDGDISYVDNSEITEEKTNYYTYTGDINTDVPGTYPVTVKAVDNYGNVSETTFNVEVKEKPKVVIPVNNKKTTNTTTTSNTATTNYNDYAVSSGDTSSIVNIAYSLVGSPYVSGGNSPERGFDCSGFVQYVYSRVGISVSRSSSTQIYDGVGVSYENAQPGDILSWGYSAGRPTHSALYIGNGMMIHATNPRQGVIVSNVAAWTSGSGTRVIAVRRI